jgi:predicted DNA-binding protein
MARPTKNSCDYFPHDAGMRNHPKVKAIRNKFANGYAVWSMLLEFLTGSDGNVFEYSELQFELISGDFGVSVTEIKDIIDYCIKIELLFNKNGFINSESLDERLAPVYIKRGKAKTQSAKQSRLNGSFCNSNADITIKAETVMPQSKVNKSKVKESKQKEINDIDDIYLAYPSKCPIRDVSNGKSSADKVKIKQLLSKFSKDTLLLAISKYVQECESKKVYMKNFKTFLNNIPDIDDMEKVTPTNGRMYSYMIPEIGEKIGTEAEYQADKLKYGKDCQFNMYK